jgi:hypothetical protein
MFIITVDGKEEEGAYSVTNEDGEQVLYIFQEEDDATRFAMMLEDRNYPEMHVIEVDDDLILKACETNDYQYAVITPNDIVIPPEDIEEHDFI